MADRVKVWDVKDERSLRRASGAHDGYTDDLYYTRWIDGGRGSYGNGSFSSLYGMMKTTQFPAGTLSLGYTMHSLGWPEFWTYGRFELTAYFWSNSTGTLELEQQMMTHDLPDGPGDDSSSNAPVTQISASHTSYAVASAPIYSIQDTSSAVVERGTGRWITIEFRRDQAGGSSDDGVSACHHLGWKVRWKPEPRQ